MVSRHRRFLPKIALGALIVVGGIAQRLGYHDARAAEGGLAATGPGWLGISMETTSSAEGVRILHVVRGSPAEKAGLKVGDAILAVGSQRVAVAVDVTRVVAGRAPGDVIDATILRDMRTLDVRISLTARPDGEDMIRMDRVGVGAPEWIDLKPLGAAPASMASLHGKVVLVDFWATWCGPCRLAMPRLSEMQARYGAQGLRIVGLTADPAERVADFAAKAGLKYPVEVDTHGATSSAYGVSVLPTLYVIDKRGVVRDVATGYDPGREAQIETLVKQLLSEPSP